MSSVILTPELPDPSLYVYLQLEFNLRDMTDFFPPLACACRLLRRHRRRKGPRVDLQR